MLSVLELYLNGVCGALSNPDVLIGTTWSIKCLEQMSCIKPELGSYSAFVTSLL